MTKEEETKKKSDGLGCVDGVVGVVVVDHACMMDAEKTREPFATRNIKK